MPTPDPHTATSAGEDACCPVRFELLGPFRVLHHNQPIDVGGRTAQAVLVTLLCNRDRTMTAGEIITATWGQRENPVDPDSVTHYMTGLRKALAPAGIIVPKGHKGFQLDIPDEAIDAARFHTLLTQAQALRTTDPEEALNRFGQALDLWHGPTALDGIRLPGIRQIADELEKHRLDAEENRAELELDRGNAEQVLARLRTLTRHHRDRTGLTAVLLRALDATGRTSEAHALADRAERTAAVNGQPLGRRLTAAIHDVRSGRRPTPQRPTSTVPFQLPPDTRDFTGRAAEVDQLLAQWSDSQDATPTLVISAVEGMAGIGKTALAVHVAHTLAERFTDGVLFINLHGYTPDTDPTPPEQALDTLLRGLGVEGQQIPPDLDGRVALYRSVLARRRVLVVLDNAADENQVRPLIPSTNGCLVLVTSRRKLLGLDDTTHIRLAPMPATDAVAFFRTIAGDRAIGGDQQTIEGIVALCGYLPLAIRIAAARLRLSDAMTPDRLHAELTTELKTNKSLGRLTDGNRTINATLAVSYQYLTPEQQHAFRLIGLHPGTHLDTYALAALADTTIEHAQQLLDDLERAHLIDQPDYHHYTQHDLIRLYATYTTQTEFDQANVLNRLFDHYSYTATLAMDTIYPYDADQRSRRIETPNARTLNLSDRIAAQMWLNTELDNLLTTATQGQPHHTLHLSATLNRHLRTRSLCADAFTLHTYGYVSAHRTGSRAGEIIALHGLGEVHLIQGRREQAIDCFSQELMIARDTSNRTGELNALNCLGYIRLMQGSRERAADCYGKALVIARDTGNRTGEIVALHGLGEVHRAQGRREQAIDCYRDEQVIACDIGDHAGELNALHGLGYIHLMQGNHKQAADSFTQELVIARNTGNRAGELNALNGLGNSHRMQGGHKLAIDCFEQARVIARDTGSHTGELNALDGLGTVCRIQGSHEKAIDCYRQELVIARDTGNCTGELNALNGLGYIHLMQGNHKQAADSFTQELVIACDAGDRNYQFEAHQGLGRTHHATGQYERARSDYHTALILVTGLAQPQDQVRAHDGLAHSNLALGHRDHARHHWQTALNLLVTNGITYTYEAQVTAEAVRTHLAGLDQQKTSTT